MHKIKFYYLLSFLAVGLFLTSCDKEDTNEITITIEEPANESTIAMASCGEVHIHVDISASVENHEVEILLHPESNMYDKIIDYDAHDHDQDITFEQEVDLCSYAAGTCFHLEVVACLDHDCAEKSTANAEFCLQ